MPSSPPRRPSFFLLRSTLAKVKKAVQSVCMYGKGENGHNGAITRMTIRPDLTHPAPVPLSLFVLQDGGRRGLVVSLHHFVLLTRIHHDDLSIHRRCFISNNAGD